MANGYLENFPIDFPLHEFPLSKPLLHCRMRSRLELIEESVSVRVQYWLVFLAAFPSFLEKTGNAVDVLPPSGLNVSVVSDRRWY